MLSNGICALLVLHKTLIYSKGKLANNLKDEIILKPIGYIETPFKDRMGVSHQPDETLIGTLHIFKEYREGIADIKPGSNGQIIFYFHKSEGCSLTVRPRGIGEPTGVFSTRSPNRPNGIGISAVRFLSNDGCKIEFSGVDMLDGTPLLDIKPQVP